MITPADLVRISWECVHFLEASEAETISEGLKRPDIIIFNVDTTWTRTKVDLLDILASEMKFPTYFKRNWDAFHECIRDFEWLPASGYVLFVWNAGPLWRRADRIAGALTELWLSSAEEWARSEVSFHLVFVW